MHIGSLEFIDIESNHLVTGVKTNKIINAGCGVTIHQAEGYSVPMSVRDSIGQRIAISDAVVLSVKDRYAPAFVDRGSDLVSPVFAQPLYNAEHHIREVTKLLSMLPSSALCELMWTKTLDPWVKYIVSDDGHSAIDHYFRPLNFVVPPVPEDIERLYQMYRKLSVRSKGVVDIALDRLNFAYRRIGSDRALDASIALEVALGGKDKEEIGYRLRLRAASLLGNNLEEKVEIANTVKKLYNLRSKVVHAGLREFNLGETASHDGLLVACRVVKRIIELGGIPHWETLELTAGGSAGTVV
jgi:hypothetical protein